MRGEAAIWLALAAVGCGGLATSSDAPTGSDAGADAPPGTPDAACSYACYRQSANGEPSAVGAAACLTPSDVCQPAFDWLEPIDVCSCSTGTPALYVLPDPQGGTARVALIAPPAPTGFGVSLTNADGQCYGAGGCAGVACGNLDVSAWVDVQISAGQNRFTIYDDDGQGCINARYTFIVTP